MPVMRLQHRAEHDTEPRVGSTVAGWRLVRPLPHEIPGVLSFVAVAKHDSGGGSGSTHWQGFSSEAPATLVHRRLDIAIDEGGSERLSRDARARHAHGGDFVRGYLEMLSDGQRRLTISQLVQETSFAQLVARQTPLAPGAIVTLLVPILESVDRAHRKGFTHGALTLSACRADDRGKPWLEAWSESVDLASLSGMRRDLALRDELRALGRVCDAVLARCIEDSVPAPAREIVEALTQGAPVAEPIPRLVDALFAWATPSSVQIERELVPSESTTPRSRETVTARAPRDDDADTLLESKAPARGGLATAIVVRSRILAGHAANIRPLVWLSLAGAGCCVAVVAPLL